MRDGADNHVFLRLLEVLAGKITLHHVLVEPCHCNHHEDSGEELFPEVCALLGVVEEEHARGVVACHGTYKSGKIIAQSLGYEHDAQHHREHKAERLERIGPDNRLHTALLSVEPDESDGKNHIHHKRNTERGKHKALEHHAHHIEAHCRAEHLRDEEEPCAALVGHCPEALLKVAIDGDEVALIEHRHEHIGYSYVAYNEAEAHLQIRETLAHHHARNRDECDARNGGSHGGKCHYIPRHTAITGKETCVVALASGKIGHKEKKNEIADYRSQHCESCHKYIDSVLCF